MLHLIIGPPGSGKTTLANEIAKPGDEILDEVNWEDVDCPVYDKMDMLFSFGKDLIVCTQSADVPDFILAEAASIHHLTFKT